MSEREPYNGAPPSVASETSEAAAEAIMPSVTRLRAQVLRYLAGTEEGATDDEIQRYLPLDANTERPRRRELELLGLVERTSRKRRTPSGRQAFVYVVTPKGWDVLEQAS